jgi:3-phosphoshikimate 1-carboxyvinyltransferase
MSAVRVAPPARPLGGDAGVPGDKSIGHRALLFGALADGTTVVRGFSGGADVLATLDAVRRLGATAAVDGDTVHVTGAGLELGAGRDGTLDCANSGTTMRLGMGLVAGATGRFTFDGDASLRRRPMERVAEPLRAMGACIETTAGRPPVRVEGGGLHGVDWLLPVASAQVKSAILLAGLRARGTTRVREPLASRDHTERLLAHMGATLVRAAGGIALAGGQRLRAADVPLPGDPSSAAFLVVAASLVPGSTIRVRAVGLNPTRTGAFAILRRMGADVRTEGVRDQAGEPRGDLIVRAARLHGTTIAPDEVPAAIDELPVLAVAAALADGETRITGAAELRAKESDRLAALEQLAVLGVTVRALPDGLVVEGVGGGRRLRPGRVDAAGDHRIAMAFAVAGLWADGGVEIADPECVAVSFPGFFAGLADLGATIEAA